jgi:acyl-coenzyme A thioesterase PaaI-like protein
VQIHTHPALDRALSGEPVALGEGTATVRLVALPVMAADARGLVHGGFVFSAADHAAMLAVNDPHVVLGAATVRFLAPVAVGEQVELLASTRAIKGRKREIDVSGTVGARPVFQGEFTAFVLDQHVLDGTSR